MIRQSGMVLSSRREGLDWMSGGSSLQSGEVLAQAAQRGCGCLIPGGVQGQVGWGPGQLGFIPDLEVGGSAVSEELEHDDPWGPFQPKPFYDSNVATFRAFISWWRREQQCKHFGMSSLWLSTLGSKQP